MRAAFGVPVLIWGIASCATTSAQIPTYDSPEFQSLVDESYAYTGRQGAEQFRSVFDEALKRSKSPSWKVLLQESRDQMARATAANRDSTILAICGRLHGDLKRAVPIFSLDEGFEFANLAAKGERQCLLQSVILTGWFREIGLDAGVAMVWKNEHGKSSNLGHVCNVVTLSNGRSVLVDASEPTAFAKHQGIFLQTEGTGYRFIEPQYRSDIIVAFKDLKSGKSAAPNRLRTLDYEYVRSQFDYYRGERAPDGILAKQATKDGLARSESMFRSALSHSPSNPLAEWMLAQTLAREGKQDQARSARAAAKEMYQEFGWIPPSMR